MTPETTQNSSIAPPITLRRRVLRIAKVALLLFLLGNFWILLHIILWTRVDPAATAFMERELARLRAADPGAGLKHRFVPFESISIHLKRAIVAAEDDGFLGHDGFEWDEIRDALERNLKRGRIVAGGSTISQQLAKNLFLSPAKNPLRKAEEALITVMIETVMTKRRILELYLNLIEWGEGVFGAEAASRHYFKIPARDLAPAQAAWLASMITSPRHYEKNRSSRRLLRKVSIIRGRMRGAAIPE